MSDTKLKIEWLNEHQTIMRIEYPVDYTVRNYIDMMVEVLEMIEDNPATIVYINYYPYGSRMPDGDIIGAASRMTKTFVVDAMIIVHETPETEIYNKALAKSFGFEEGKNVWFFRDETEARKLAEQLDKQLNPYINDKTPKIS